MSTPIVSGGPAFPHGDVRGIAAESFGMTLRDWFAGRAMSAMLAVESLQELSDDKIALFAYKAADAMLAERAKEAAK